MAADLRLINRIRGEYREMPGLRLTLAQACRLWQMDALVCQSILDALVEAGALFRTADGSFVASPTRVGVPDDTPRMRRREAG